jgi:outer membrane protein assembly factor BamA
MLQTASLDHIYSKILAFIHQSWPITRIIYETPFNPMNLRDTILFILIVLSSPVLAQEDTSATKQVDTSGVKKDTLSKFDSFNAKAEHLFKILPVPLYSYSTEAGNTFGLAKFNLFQLKKSDTISKPSKLSEVVTLSSKGRVNASVTTELVFKENKWVILSYVNYKKQPEYIFGIGNDVKKEDVEEVQYERFKSVTVALSLFSENLYIGVPLDIADYFNIKPDSNSFLLEDGGYTGIEGGFTLGTGIAAAWDSRDNRYNTSKGSYVQLTLIAHPEWLGSAYTFTKFELDMRKFFNPWKKHIIAFQATTSSATGNTPFYELSLLGGDKQMRGYYQGAYRDKVLVDGQVEYRMPVWKIFGVTGWMGTGRVASAYDDLTLDNWKLSYGFGIRIKVDSKNNTNMRLDFGFGPHGISGTYINFAEAF